MFFYLTVFNGIIFFSFGRLGCINISLLHCLFCWNILLCITQTLAWSSILLMFKYLNEFSTMRSCYTLLLHPLYIPLQNNLPQTCCDTPKGLSQTLNLHHIPPSVLCYSFISDIRSKSSGITPNQLAASRIANQPGHYQGISGTPHHFLSLPDILSFHYICLFSFTVITPFILGLLISFFSLG